MDPVTLVLYVVSAIVLILIITAVVKSVTVVRQAEAAVIERLGRYQRTAAPGLTILVPFIDRIRERVALWEQVVSFPPQPVITQDNLTVSIDTVVYYQVTEPRNAVYEISDYINGVQQLTTTTLRDVVGGMSLEEALTSRETINTRLRRALDDATGPWGLRVVRVELKAIDPPPSIQHSMEQQMKADREKRAMILTAEGHRESSIAAAQGNKQAAILNAEGNKQAAILEAEADRQATHAARPGRAGRRVLPGAGRGQGDREDVRRDQGRAPDAGDAGLPVPADAAADGAGRQQQDVGGAQRLRQGARGLHEDARGARRGRRVPLPALAPRTPRLRRVRATRTRTWRTGST